MSVLSFWRNLLQRDRVERDLDDELRATLEALVDEKVRAGMAQEVARRTSRAELGSVEAIKDNVRDVRAGAFVDTLAQVQRRRGGRDAARGRWCLRGDRLYGDPAHARDRNSPVPWRRSIRRHLPRAAAGNASGCLRHGHGHADGGERRCVAPAVTGATAGPADLCCDGDALLLVGGAACYLPVRRATRIRAMEALRAE